MCVIDFLKTIFTLLCEFSHNMQLRLSLQSVVSNYKTFLLLHPQFHKEARDIQNLLKKLDTDINQKYNPDSKDTNQLDGLVSDLDVSSFPPLNITQSTTYIC